MLNVLLTSKKKVEKSEKIFNSFFAKQYSLIDNGSIFPSLFRLIKNFLMEHIKSMISKLDTSKTQGNVLVNPHMFKSHNEAI